MMRIAMAITIMLTHQLIINRYLVGMEVLLKDLQLNNTKVF